ncbi:PEP-CTERM sorting domain-containing protein [Sphaerotilus montanus]|uniref:C-type lectin domain-containing protein n=1 Tax=Sphaerotilus montanus TaxID=522889 RepID=A0A7Y9R2B2_9BURK|nr:PEP-CTERM sorting domain-containing protein [Sphaerotilus montanus]NYG34969.1 hypothetical protein [Sphaerotilus montanus]
MSKISSIHVAICAVLAACSLSAHSAPETLANNGHTYEWISGPFSWDQALADASTHTNAGQTGYMATITSAAENDFVHGLANTRLAWIGASQVNGDWVWRAGPEAGQALSYSNWGTNQGLNQSLETHAGINWFGQTQKRWDDFGVVVQTFGYVVEYDAVTAVPEPETYAMMLAGLGALSLVARRRVR